MTRQEVVQRLRCCVRSHRTTASFGPLRQPPRTFNDVGEDRIDFPS
jgi:hypothetical protein